MSQIPSLKFRTAVALQLSRAALLCLALGCMSGPAWSLEIEFQRLITERNNTEYDVGSIVALAQDRKGFIWIGAEYGLARFDGKLTTHYPLVDTPSGGTYVNDILVDHQDRLWVATERGVHLYDEHTDSFTWLKPFPENAALNRVAALTTDQDNQLVLVRPKGFSIYQPENRLFKHFALPGDVDEPVVAAMVDKTNRIWLGTRGAGVVVFNQKSNRFSFYHHDAKLPGSVGDDQITTITEDAKGRIWVGTKTAGVSRLDPNARAFTHFRYDPNNPQSLRHNYIRDVFNDSRGNIWVVTDHGGLSLFDEDSATFQHFMHNAYDPTTLASNQGRQILEDKNGDLWVSTFPVGLNYYNRAAAQFTNYTHKPDRSDSLSHAAVLCFLKDSAGDIWVGTENGLNQFHPEQQNFTRYLPNRSNPSALQAGAVIALAEENAETLWAGTWSGGLHKFDKRTGEFTNYQPDGKPNSLGSPFIWALLKDTKNRMWVGTEGAGLNLYRPETDDFKQFRHQPNANSINHNDVWSIIQDHLGQLWVGTTGGLNRFDPETEEFYNFPREAGNPHTVDSERVRALFQDSDQRIWVGTQETGLFVYDFGTDRFKHFTTEHGLPTAYITGFTEDDQGFIWVSTANGAVKVDPSDMSMTLFNKSHGLVGDNLYRYAGMKTDTGEIYLGGTEGFSVFDPLKVQQYPADAVVQFTGVTVPTSNGHSSSRLRIHSVDNTHKLMLDYRDTIFAIDFSALDFRSARNTRYAYKLDGFEDRWTETGDINSVTYTNLNPGKYKFLIKAGTLSGWSPHVSELEIQIEPPPWLTWWAFSAYIGLLCLAVWLIIHAKIKQLQFQGEREVTSQLRNLNAMKDAFLANTSHELRTPLNGIIGIAESLRGRAGLQDKFTSNHLDLIISSGKRLSSLINDILDYSRLANNKLSLSTKPVDMYELTANVFVLLEPLTQTNNIQLVNNIQHLAPFVMGDENRLQQILINLVGNGIKYTPRGTVSVDFKIHDSVAYTSVTDTGLGIIEEKQASIFDAFSQGDSSDARVYDGSGLGLAITRQLVELHNGEIWVESIPGKGSKFVFTLPAASEKDAKPRPIPSQKKPNKAAPAHTDDTHAIAQIANARSLEPTVVIVDDDSVNRMVLKGMLGLHNYHILEASSGAEAIEIIKQQAVDLVILDVMMPSMSGYEACKIVRESFPVEALPIIFLTAKTEEDEINTCFEMGGNDYLTKPVNKNVLLSRVAHHLKIRAAVRRLLKIQ